MRQPNLFIHSQSYLFPPFSWDDCTESDRLTNHKERSPLAPNTKQCDDCTDSDRLS
ncbi:hypothetical protein Q5691_07560 [Microcoleus sp. w1-18aA5]|uniref:hypothetical protein n=1 Tax=Microcoleus sp. w1-18aA5 TaxID=2818982 RepID=UPI002FD18C38